MTVREAQQRIDRAEFAEWVAFSRMDPIGGKRLDLLVAQIVAAIRPPSKDESKTLEDYVIQWAEPDQEPKPVDPMAIRNKMLAAFGLHDLIGK